MSEVSQPDSLLEKRLIEALINIVGERNVILDSDLKGSYENDITGRYKGQAKLIVLPATTKECSLVLKECSNFNVPIVPQGGNTGLVGGAVPKPGEVVLSTRRMTNIEMLDKMSRQITVGAGVTLQDAQDSAKRAGYELAIDHSARSAASIGGMVATDAGGTIALRYGTMRNQVVGLEAVLADGSIVSRMSGLLKDNAGYRWPDILAGSEGTLAVITRVRLQLRELPSQKVSALFGVHSLKDALNLLYNLRAYAPSLRAADFFTDIELICHHRQLPLPLQRKHKVYVIVECAGQGDLLEELSIASDEAGVGEDIAVADDTASRERLWLYRDGQNEAVGANGIPHKLDVSVPIKQIPAFVETLKEKLGAEHPAAQLVLYGHLGDGNLHINILGLDTEDFTTDGEILQLVAEHGGSISAEHGIGIAKTEWLDLVRSKEEIILMRALKTAFDPSGLLSPGRILSRTVRHNFQ